MTIIISTHTSKGTLQHTTKVETTELDTLPNETEGTRQKDKSSLR
jgi:hypothetical protein